MKPRIKKVLEILLSTDGWIPVPKLAEKTGAGERTLFRDLIELEYYLKAYNVQVLKKRSVGVRLDGDINNLNFQNKRTTIKLSWLTPLQRQLAIITYLGFSPQIIKLSELATLLSVSDSCISTDLKEIDLLIQTKQINLSLIRQKGIGIMLSGPEWTLRMFVLESFLHLFEVSDILETILQTGRNTLSEQLFKALHIDAEIDRLFNAINESEKKIGVHFSWSDLVLLFIYLALALRRKVIFFEESSGFPHSDSTDFSISFASLLWNLLTMKDEKEIMWLSVLLSSLESGEVNETLYIYPGIKNIVLSCIPQFFAKNIISINFDPQLQKILEVQLSSIILKKNYKIPIVSHSTYDDHILDSYTILIDDILIPEIYKTLSIKLDSQDLIPVKLIFASTNDSYILSKKNIRVVVSCIEGICLANLITNTIKKNFLQVSIIASLSNDKLSETWLASERIDLIVSTFPTHLSWAEEFIVPNPFSVDDFIKSFADYLENTFVKTNFSQKNQNSQNKQEVAYNTSVQSSLDLIQSFKLKTISTQYTDIEIIQLITNEILQVKKDKILLQKELELRESYGSVLLENSNIRLFHCRSKIIKTAIAGLIRNSVTGEIYFYLIAPFMASKEEIAILSTISIALSEDESFVYALRTMTENEIQKILFTLLAFTT